MEKEKIYVEIYVPKFVKRYLDVNFGHDSKTKRNYNISSDRTLFLMLQTALIRQWKKRDGRKRGIYRYRNQLVGIEISAKDFRDRGWALTETEEAAFVNFLEVRCRMIAEIYLNCLSIVFPRFTDAIKYFYKLTGWSNETWPEMSIRKIWERRTEAHQFELKDVFLEKFNKIIITTLSQNATITKRAKEIYENNADEL